MSINIVQEIDGAVKVARVLISVSDKQGLEDLVPAMVRLNPALEIFSTGGTYGRIKEILGADADDHLQQVSDYTGQPETQGGLVKTLDFKVYLGLLTETYNEAHQQDLARTAAVAIDMVVVNLYPFAQTIARPDVSPEQARGNVDIGGPCMIRASAKNFIRVASVVDPTDYAAIIDELQASGGTLSLAMRYRLARKAFEHTAEYDRTIADYLRQTPVEKITACYPTVH